MKFVSKPVPEHKEVPLADEGRWEEIVDQWSAREQLPFQSNDNQRQGVYVLSVGPQRDSRVREAQLTEILELVEAQGRSVVGHEIYHLSKARPKTLIGKGAAREIAQRARSCQAELLVIDAELTPSQMRNLEDMAGIAICDREAVILNVFLRHANTRRARVQVELAHLEYLRPRIRGIGLNMDQQIGGVAGSRGPGETASELLARKLDGRLAELRKVERRLRLCSQRQRQRRGSSQRIALVGYTNAGKTSLMNGLAQQQLSARDRPFETLDTTSRSLSRHGEEVILSDTVGFIRRLPERLLASFESTLAEAREASLLVVVTDISDYEWQNHLKTTVELLNKLGAGHVQRFYVFNKLDRLPSTPVPKVLRELCQGEPYLVLSSRDQEAVSNLRQRLLDAVRRRQVRQTLFVPYEQAEVMSLLYGQSRVLASESTPRGLKLTVEGCPQVMVRANELLEEKLQ